MSVLRNPWWWVVVAAFVGHTLLERGLGIGLGLVDSYLDPFCSIPILLGLWGLERQLIFRITRLDAIETAVATLVLAVVFEEVFPGYQEGFRRDTLDYVFYGLGGVYFYFLVNGRFR